MVDLLKKSSTISILITILYIAGIGIYSIIIDLFEIPLVSEQITIVVNYVFNLIFGCLDFLGFFIRPSTLSFACKLFCYYYLLYYEFKFMKICIKLATGLYSKVSNLLGKTSSVVFKMFGF